MASVAFVATMPILPVRTSLRTKQCFLVSTLALVATGTWRARRYATKMATKPSVQSNQALLGGDGVVVEAPSGEATAAVIFLHGLGDTGRGWESAFPLPGLDHVRTLLPNANNMPVTLNGGYVMPSWFDLYGLDPTARDDTDGIDAAVARVNSIIDATGLPSERVVVAGFSQGGAIAYTTALRSQRRLAGTVALSTWVPRRAEYPAAFGPYAKTIPFFAGHGTADDVLALEFGKVSAQTLREHGVSVEFHSYHGVAHAVCEEEFKHLSAFLKNVLPPEQKA